MRRTIKSCCQQIDYGVGLASTPEPVGPKYLRITDIENSWIDWSSVPYCIINQSEASRYALAEGDIVVARTGASTGRSQWIGNPSDAVFASYLVRLRTKSDVDSRFLAFALQSRAWRHYVSSVSSAKSAQPNMSATAMASFELDVPPLPEQRAIAEVLGALDDKIAANSKAEARIVELGVALVTRQTADGIQTTVGQVANFHNRHRVPLSARQRLERLGSVPYWGANGQMDTVSEALFHEPLVLVGEDGSVVTSQGRAVVHHVWGPTWVNNHAHVLTGEGLSTELLWFLMRDLEVAQAVTGAVQPKLSMGNLKALPMVVPAKMGTLEQIIRPLVELYRTTSEQSQALVTLRDTLLPALMDGTIRVKDAITQAEEVL